jgi:hypothetical protein
VTQKAQPVTIELRFSTGKDEPERGIYRNQAIEPENGDELLIALHQLTEPDDVLPGNPFQRQVELVGTPAGLEALGTYLIALARLQTADPEPHGHLDNVRAAGGGTISLIPRRVPKLPAEGS